NRWGDYSALTVDPVDGCTFWYTNEYYSTTSQFNWRTRIGTFKFPTCSTAVGTLSGTVTDSVTHNGISGATVQVVGGGSTTTDATGHYSMNVAVGTVSVTFSKTGYTGATVNNVVIAQNATTTQDAVLVGKAVLTISKTADAASVPGGSTIGFTVTITNSG